jgi:hypothetical protein
MTVSSQILTDSPFKNIFPHYSTPHTLVTSAAEWNQFKENPTEKHKTHE